LPLFGSDLDRGLRQSTEGERSALLALTSATAVRRGGPVAGVAQTAEAAELAREFEHYQTLATGLEQVTQQTDQQATKGRATACRLKPAAAR
jgi:phage shock protein A